jgi:hypothetical protein
MTTVLLEGRGEGRARARTTCIGAVGFIITKGPDGRRAPPFERRPDIGAMGAVGFIITKGPDGRRAPPFERRPDIGAMGAVGFIVTKGLSAGRLAPPVERGPDMGGVMPILVAREHSSTDTALVKGRIPGRERARLHGRVHSTSTIVINIATRFEVSMFAMIKTSSLWFRCRWYNTLYETVVNVRNPQVGEFNLCRSADCKCFLSLVLYLSRIQRICYSRYLNLFSSIV